MSERIRFKVEPLQLLELKAKVADLGIIRTKINQLEVQSVGVFHQKDVYYEVPEGRLKLREVKGSNVAELIYYEREDVAGPKRSVVTILRIPRNGDFRKILERLLTIRVMVEKVREIYQYQGTQIHLDSVFNLGHFVEFERKTSANIHALNKNRQVLERLMGKLGITSKNLEERSYCDLVQKY